MLYATWSLMLDITAKQSGKHSLLITVVNFLLKVSISSNCSL